MASHEVTLSDIEAEHFNKLVGLLVRAYAMLSTPVFYSDRCTFSKFQCLLSRLLTVSVNHDYLCPALPTLG